MAPLSVVCVLVLWVSYTPVHDLLRESCVHVTTSPESEVSAIAWYLLPVAIPGQLCITPVSCMSYMKGILSV